MRTVEELREEMVYTGGICLRRQTSNFRTFMKILKAKIHLNLQHHINILIRDVCVASSDQRLYDLRQTACKTQKHTEYKNP